MISWIIIAPKQWAPYNRFLQSLPWIRSRWSALMLERSSDWKMCDLSSTKSWRWGWQCANVTKWIKPWGRYAEGNKAAIKRQTLRDSTYTKYLEKSNSQTENRMIVARVWGGEEWEMLMGITFHFCKVKGVPAPLSELFDHFPFIYWFREFDQLDLCISSPITTDNFQFVCLFLVTLPSV